jgi:hypothetical protein
MSLVIVGESPHMMHSALRFRSLIVLNMVEELAEKSVIVGGSSSTIGG